MTKKYDNLMTNNDRDVFIPIVPSVLGAMLMSKVSRQKDGFREDLIAMVENDELNLPEDNYYENFKNSFVVANGFMEKWGINYGHSSIKELDHLQMCIENRSRWFTEIIEALHNNLHWSYIEYSLRYNPPTDYVVPKELDNQPELKEKYITFCDEAFSAYEKLMPLFFEAIKAKNPDKSDAAVKKLAFENARNVLPLSVKSNMGLATNLRAFCDGLSELFAHEDLNDEIVQTAALMKEEGETVSPGMVKHVQPTEYMKSFVEGFYRRAEVTEDLKQKIYYLPEAKVTGELSTDMVNDRLLGDLSKMTRFDQLPKQFKTVGKNVEVLMSEAGHHQLIRHRSLDIMPYYPDVNYGLLIPYEAAVIKDTEAGKQIIEIIVDVYKKSVDVYESLCHNGLLNIAPYVVINANMRKAQFFGNVQGMGHFITLRTEEHAQDEIRIVAREIEKGYKEIYELFPNIKFNKNEEE